MASPDPNIIYRRAVKILIAVVTYSVASRGNTRFSVQDKKAYTDVSDFIKTIIHLVNDKFKPCY